MEGMGMFTARRADVLRQKRDRGNDLPGKWRPGRPFRSSVRSLREEVSAEPSSRCSCPSRHSVRR